MTNGYLIKSSNGTKYVRSLDEAKKFIKTHPTAKVYRAKSVNLPAGNVRRKAYV